MAWSEQRHDRCGGRALARSLVRSRNRPVSQLGIPAGLGQNTVFVASTPVNRLQTAVIRVRPGS
jgi:hypothetical protein